MVSVRIKRVYEPAAPSDGARVLVDRLWPRGIRKEDAALDAWRKDVAPSTALRTFYGHRPERFAEFSRRYRDELSAPEAATALNEVMMLARRRTLTLITATRDLDLSGAMVLAEYLRAM